MNKILILLFAILPCTGFANEVDLNDIIEVGIRVVVLGEQESENLSVDFTKHTIDKKSVKINLKGFDGELMAMITPEIIGLDVLQIKAMLEIRDMEGEIIKSNNDVINYKLGDKLLFYPLGQKGDHPIIILELVLNKINGIELEDR